MNPCYATYTRSIDGIDGVSYNTQVRYTCESAGIINGKQIHRLVLCFTINAIRYITISLNNNYLAARGPASRDVGGKVSTSFSMIDPPSIKGLLRRVGCAISWTINTPATTVL